MENMFNYLKTGVYIFKSMHSDLTVQHLINNLTLMTGIGQSMLLLPDPESTEVSRDFHLIAMDFTGLCTESMSTKA